MLFEGERQLVQWLVWAWMAMAGLAFVALLVRTAPYGRFSRPGWGPTVPARIGWAVMESPGLWGMAILFALGEHRSPAAWAFVGLWGLHSVHRVILYPVRMRPGHRLAASVMLMGVGFHVVNAYLQGRWIFQFGPVRGAGWLADPRFLAGTAMFLGGFAVNVHADNMLRRLRRRSEDTYAIPRGGLFRWVSCPNYLGEIIEWIGWTVLTWSPAGLAFAVWTVANLLPRAISTHKWYRRTFPDYPPHRKALLPGLL